MEKMYFNIDSDENFYEGYTDNTIKWNGWAMPYFSKDVAKLFAERNSTNEFKIIFDEDKDAFIVNIYENDKIKDTEIYEKTIIDTKEGKKEVYPLGAGSWVWDAYTLEEMKRFKEVNMISEDTELNEEIEI